MTPPLPPREVLSNPPPGLKYISICSGIEAATVAFHPLGWQPLAFAEIEAFPSAVLAHHYPAVPNLGDMTAYHDWPEELLAECDLLVGGPPCQAFSVAGLRNSLSDARGNLTLTYVNLINHIDNIRRKHGRDPIIALYENVPGIYSTKDNAFGCLVGAICGQDAPVETETGKWPTTGVFWGEKRRVGYRTLDAQYFGVAQRRRRCFLLAVPNELVERIGDRACPSEILSIAESLRGHPAPSREKGESVARDAESGVADGCWWDGGQVSQTLDAVLSKGQTMPEKNRFPAVLQPVTPSLTGNPYGDHESRDGLLVTHSLRGEGFDASEDGTGRGIPLVVGALDTECGGNKLTSQSLNNGHFIPVAFPERLSGTQCVRSENLSPSLGSTNPTAVAFSCKDHGGDAGEMAPTLRAMGHAGSHANAGGQLAVAFDLRGREGAAMLEGPHDTANIRAASGGSSRSYIAAPMAVRRLTPEECEALQGFPRNYTLVPFRKKPAADGNRYKALGNSMAVPCMAYLGYRIQMALRNPAKAA